MRGGIPASERGQWRVVGSALVCAPCASEKRSARCAAKVGPQPTALLESSCLARCSFWKVVLTDPRMRPSACAAEGEVLERCQGAQLRADREGAVPEAHRQRQGMAQEQQLQRAVPSHVRALQQCGLLCACSAYKALSPTGEPPVGSSIWYNQAAGCLLRACTRLAVEHGCAGWRRMSESTARRVTVAELRQELAAVQAVQRSLSDPTLTASEQLDAAAFCSGE